MNDRAVVSAEFSKAFERLREGAAEDPSKSELVIDGLIQRFEFTFELGWKLLKSLLDYQGVYCTSPRGCIKEAAATGMVNDGDAWIGMLEARNRTAHLYDRDEALAVYRTIKATYLPLLRDLEEAARRSLRD